MNITHHVDLNQFQNLLENGTNVNTQDVSGNYLIHIAILADHIELVNLLLTRGANPNVRNQAGEPPLMLAVKKGHSILLDLLFNHRAEANLEDVLVMSSYLLRNVNR